jgi:hypothetical protein
MRIRMECAGFDGGREPHFAAMIVGEERYGTEGISAEVRERIVALVEGGRKVLEVAADFELCEQSIYTWLRMQVELLDRRRWRMRVKLANAIFEYLEVFHNRRRRYFALGMLPPVEYEHRSMSTRQREPRIPTPRNPIHARASGNPGTIHQITCVVP